MDSDLTISPHFVRFQARGQNKNMCTGRHQNDKYSDLGQSDLQHSVGPITGCSQTRKMTVTKYLTCLAILCYLTDIPFLNTDPVEV